MAKRRDCHHCHEPFLAMFSNEGALCIECRMVRSKRKMRVAGARWRRAYEKRMLEAVFGAP